MQNKSLNLPQMVVSVLQDQNGQPCSPKEIANLVIQKFPEYAEQKKLETKQKNFNLHTQIINQFYAGRKKWMESYPQVQYYDSSETTYCWVNSEGNDKQLQRQQDQQSSSRTTFSHTIRAHSILSASNLSSRRASGFIVEINATEEERNALVARFGAVNSFSSIGLLSADLRLRRASTASNSFSTFSGSSTTNGAS